MKMKKIFSEEDLRYKTLKQAKSLYYRVILLALTLGILSLLINDSNHKSFDFISLAFLSLAIISFILAQRKPSEKKLLFLMKIYIDDEIRNWSGVYTEEEASNLQKIRSSLEERINDLVNS
jgi:hypothetical protein